MKKMIKVLGLVAIMTLGMSTQVFAGEWKQDNIGWWYQNNDNSYPVNRWEWVDGNHDGIAECYYFNENGYCLMATTTPDNYTVNESGAWTVDGVVQTKSVSMEDGENKGINEHNLDRIPTDNNGNQVKNTDGNDYSESANLWGMTEEEYRKALEEAFENQGHDNYGGWN